MTETDTLDANAHSMWLRFRLRTMLIAVAMAAIAMLSMQTSVPEDRTFKGLVPLLCFALIGVWAAASRGWSIIRGGAAGGVVGAISNVATQQFYYQHLHNDPFASVTYLGPATCLVIDSVVGVILGLILGSVVWLSIWLRAKARSSRVGSHAEKLPPRSTTLN
jgi:hypothetical protein